MLCFIFAALIVALDQFFKHWIMRTLDIGDVGPEVIPGILGLTRWENDGAMLNILSGQQWLLAGIAFGAAIVLIMILLRYNEGFWGTLGLAAVLGGTVGNLADRVFNGGKVVDMFRTLFIDFPIFNIADIFITLGFITFLVHFIVLTVKGEKNERSTGYYNEGVYDNNYDNSSYDEFPNADVVSSAQDEAYTAESHADYTVPAQQAQYSEQEQYVPENYTAPQSEYVASNDYEPIADTATDTSYTLDALKAELDLMDDDYGDYNVDDLLREYGFEDEDTL